MAPQYPLVNGIRYDWSTAEIVVNKKKILGITSLNYSDGLEPGEVYGTHPQKLGRTRGQYKPEGSLEMYKQEADELMATLGDGFFEKSFDVVVSYSAPGQPTVTDKVMGCRIKKVDTSFASGTDALKVKLDLDVMLIIRNGIKPLVNTIGV